MLSLEAKLGSLGEAINFIDEELSAISCPQEVVSQIELAVEEIFMNISSYAYNGEAGGVTLMVHSATGEKKPVVNITIIDHGKIFNPLNHEDPDVNIPLEDRDPGGLGIFFVKKMMTSIMYKYENGRNHIVLSKSW
jgi:anti-sigma regulatory factor (Ser/Thr protein kinase)